MIKLITDSTCDMAARRLEQLDIEVVPLAINFGERTYVDKVDLDNSQFYQMLRQAKTLPTTSQVSPGAFEAVFRRHTERGDTVVGLFISSKLSGTCQSAAIAAQLVGPHRIHIVDSLTTTLGLSLMLEHAARWRDEGLAADALAQRLEAMAQRVTILAVVETLQYLKMGGRLSAASAMIGGLLNLCPIITLSGGLVEAVGKGRGKKAAYAKLGELYRQAGPDQSYGVSIGHGDAPSELARVLEALGGDYDAQRVLEHEIGSVIGTHVGPGVGGVAFVRK